jgi:aryl-alcohol dehydrogenase-like predicted oxidoreductase
MESRPLGRTGLTVSALGFGAGAIGGLMVRGEPAAQRAAVARALAAGITYFDTAPGYGNGRSEENLGRVLTELGAWGRVVVGTKVRLGVDDLRDPVAAIRRSAEASLRRLGHDTVDLIQLHNRLGPGRDAGDPGVGLAEITGGVGEGLAALVRAGLARHAGYTGLGEPATLLAAARSGRLATVQSYFNPLNPSAGYAGRGGGGEDFAGLIDAAAAAGLGVIVIRPFAAGALGATPERHALAGDPSGTLAGSAYDDDRERARRLGPLVAEFGLESPYELALRFALAKPGVSTVLVGYSDGAQLEEAIRWAERGPLPAAAVEQVVALA